MSHFKHSLGYRPVSELISEVKYDLSNYDNFGYIDSYQIARLVLYKMYEIGLRIFQHKEMITEVKNHYFNLPIFFVTYNFGFVCFKKEECLDNSLCISQTTCDIDNKNLPANNEFICSEGDQRIFFNSCGGAFQMVCKKNNVVRTFKNIKPLVLSNRYYDSGPLSRICRNCNFNINPLDVGYAFNDKVYLEIYDKKMGFLQQVKEATVYINFVSVPYDYENKELLVPDNPIISQYLEYAIKKKVMENVVLNNNDTGAAQKLQLIEQGYREYSNKAHALVNTPNFKEMADVWKMNRLALERKYYHIFS
jgi:hypothetical protein